MTEKDNEDQRPSKMIGVVFPKAKYGVIAAIITPYFALGNTTPIILLGRCSLLLFSAIKRIL